MNTTKPTHTPGPWMATDHDGMDPQDGMPLTTVYAENGQRVANVPPCDEQEVNARLIAAAPELLAALKALHEIAFADAADLSYNEKVLVNVRAAILRAEGAR
jgi:hypothetical protein